MGDDLNERSRRILEAIVEDYIASAEPVGSKAVTRRHHMGLSPATVRNVMAELEGLGLIASPHASAGRVPTDKGYRLYIDSILQVRALSTDEQERIERYCASRRLRSEEIMKEAVRTLSRLSSYAGIVMAPRFSANLFRRIDFVPLGPGRILAIFVSHSGEVQNRIVESAEEIPASALEEMTAYLNRVMPGLSIEDVRERIAREMIEEKAHYDDLQRRALAFSQRALAENETGEDVIIDGASRILDQPEFADVERMRRLFRAFEQKNQLIDLLDRSRHAHGVQIFIGSETRYSEIEGCSLVTANFATRSGTVGALGVIGPSRMPYAQVIPIVDYTARVVSQLLESE